MTETDVRVIRLAKEVEQVSPAVLGRKCGNRKEEAVVWRVPEERPLAILLNGETFAVMMTTPTDLEDFAVGFALTEGIVETIDQIESIRLADVADGALCNLTVDSARVENVAERRRSIAGRAGCGLCGAQTIGAALPQLPKVSGTAPSVATLRAAYAALPGRQRMNAENRSTHAAAFCDGSGELLAVREDIGRHNALDKLGGALARAGLRARDGFILLSSRISVEMVQKAAMLGSPFLAAVSAPSALALRQASDAGMGLACGNEDEVMVFDPPSICDDLARSA